MTPLIGNILVKNQFCKSADIEKALEIQKSYGRIKIGGILMNMGTITEEQLLRALSIQFEISYLPKTDELPVVDIGVDSAVLASGNVYPFEKSDKIIKVATNDPLKLELFTFIENSTEKKVEVALATDENLKQMAGKMQDGISIRPEAINYEDEIEKLRELASEAPVIKIVNSVISKAIELQATDIHFESLKHGMKVRLRIDGILRMFDKIPRNLKLAVVARLKLLSGMNISESRLAQDGRISVKVAGKALDIRASSVPTQYGESFVLRLLLEESAEYSMEKLGFYKDHIELIRGVILRPNGIFLTTGPTGSGKTTTLYSILSELNSDSVKIVTVEDPIEYELAGINQIQVKPDIGLTFANALRNILRQDPDIIMIGEIRDEETAKMAIQAALTGHLVLSTLHTNSALASITRLIDMGMEPFLLKATIIGVMAQRLVRMICPFCSHKTDISDELKQAYGIDELIKKYGFVSISPSKGEGCEHCNNTGYKGRIVISEIVPFDRKVQDTFDKNKNFNEIGQLGYRSMFEDGLLKVSEGKTSIKEILRVC